MDVPVWMLLVWLGFWPIFALAAASSAEVAAWRAYRYFAREREAALRERVRQLEAELCDLRQRTLTYRSGA